MQIRSKCRLDFLLNLHFILFRSIAEVVQAFSGIVDLRPIVGFNSRFIIENSFQL